jgi:amino acid adenylation domain-containing protein
MKNVEDVYPLSPMQEGMLFHTLLAPGSGAYVVHISSRIDGEFDVAAFKRAWQDLLTRHPILRSAFLWQGLEHPLQVVRTELALTWDEPDWSALGAEAQELALQDYLDREHSRGFDLAQAPLMRMALIRLGSARHQFLWSYSHLLLDGWSVNLLWAEMFSFYKAYAEKRLPRMTELRPYKDFIRWLGAQDRSKAEAFWRRSLDGFTEPTPLPIDTFSVSSVMSGISAYKEIAALLTPELTMKLKEAARRNRLTVSTVVQGAWAWLLAYHSRLSEVVFGVTVTGRPVALPGVDSLVGLLVNTIPLRVHIPANEPLLDWLKTIQDLQTEAREYEYSSLVEIKAWSDMPPSLPLFESFVVFENHPVATGIQHLDGKVELVSNRVLESAAYPLTFLAEPGDRIRLRIMYDSARYREAAIEKLLTQLELILEQMERSLERPLHDLFLLSASERGQVLTDWNGTEHPVPGTNLITFFEKQAVRTPTDVAASFEGDSLDYATLNTRANQLGRWLQQAGVGPDMRVGLFVERSLEMVVGILGILKSGAAYIPLDPGYPQDRVSFMLNDAEVTILLTHSKLLSRLPVYQGRILELDQARNTIGGLSQENLNVSLRPENLAYLIYTSGSSGRPKGVMNTHEGLANRILWMQSEYGLESGDRVLQKTPFSFDVSVWEFLWPLCVGATLVMARPGGHQDPGYLARVIQEQGITTIHFVPSMLEAFLQGREVKDCSSLRRIICSGEALSPDLAGKCMKAIPWAGLHNLYGPTEAAIDVSSWACVEEEGRASVPIGRPIWNIRLYVLDKWLQPVPVGVAGDLYIAGIGLARGYWRRADLTAERFIPNPYGEAGSRMYCTGDLARWREDGVLEFLGRLDDQVKIRGFRIELGEIEAVLSTYPDVVQAVVAAREDVAGDKRLVAYLVNGGRTASSEELREYLRQRLPAYMVPSHFINLEQLPLTPNGKLNRKALPRPEQETVTEQYVRPETTEQEILCGIWSEVLGAGNVGIHDNFFNLGGHSLLATQVLSRIRQAFDVELPLRAIFDSPTIAQLALTLVHEM